MKAALLSLIAVLVVMWNANQTFAKDPEKGTGVEKQEKQKGMQQEQSSIKESDANQPKEQARGRQARQQVIERSQVHEGGGKEPKAPKSEWSREQSNSESGKGVGPSAEKTGDKGRMHQQQGRAMGKKMLHEEAKHRQRVARLNRIRELAAEEGDTKILERVDKLLQKEQQRYISMRERIGVKDERVLQITGENISREARKTTDAEPNKPQLKGDRQKKGRDNRDDKNTNKEIGK